MLRTMESERDRLLLREEMLRLKARGYCFNGQTLAEQLGVDQWVLGASIVEEKLNGDKAVRERLRLADKWVARTWKGLEA